MHNPLKVILDFRSITPRMDVRNKNFQPIVLKHNVIVLDPFVAKNLLQMLSDNLKQYEKEFGKIKIPDALKKVQKQDTPSYFG